MIQPGKTIGLMGGGPIGRMLARAAQSLGYHVSMYVPPGAEPAEEAGLSREVRASYDDVAALKEFARQVDVITCACENIPAEPLNAIAPLVPLMPRVEALQVCQNRQRAKAWLRMNGFPQLRYAEALDGDVESVIAQVGRPCVVKTADFDHDGRGQMKITTDADLERAAAIYRGRRCTMERWVDFSCEVSVIVARTATGEMRAFPPTENVHKRYILDYSIAPARIGPAITREAVLLATAMAEKLGIVGILAAEMFITPGGEVLVNELAPRPHNSGHWTLDGCETSQFEQHIRAVCGLPLGAVEVRQPTVMVNVLGDAWTRPTDRAPAGVRREPNWQAILGAPRAKLHLYGETEPRSGRKMGHFTVWDSTVDAAIARAKELEAGL